MHLILAPPVVERLRRELRRAGKREIGGLLMGEHVEHETFRVVEISVQRSGGSAACFIRHPREHQAELDKFFEQTGRDYTRFNYMGEWHSHPSFPPIPSGPDLRTMQSIVSDPDVGVNFLVLLIPRLTSRQTMELSATAFRPHARPKTVNVRAEPGERRLGLTARVLHRIFRL